MTAHTHTVITPGCYRCDLNADEVLAAEREEAEQAAREAACPGHKWDHRSSPFGDWEVCLLCGMEEEL